VTDVHSIFIGMIELAGIIILGVGAQWLSWRMKVPAILPLILLGLLVGPVSTLLSSTGTKWLSPIYDPATGQGIFQEGYFFYFVSLAIGIILFEGGLTLKRKEIRNLGPAILGLVSVGAVVTFVMASFAAYLLLNLAPSIAMLFGALIIVTGPTVIAPILRNVPLSRNVSTILKWESIIIDPIGALVAVLVFEFILSNHGAIAFTPVALWSFVKVVLVGLIMGTASGYLLFQLVRRNLVPHYLLNVFTLAVVLGAFVMADEVAEESGLLTVVVMGMVLGNLDMPKLKDILDFKESLSILLISILFIVLGAHINLSDLALLQDWRCIALLAVVVLIIRPLSVALSTRGAQLSVNEKAFIAFIGPRGIVAAGIASLFGLRLVKEGVSGADYITPLVFMVVLGTVLLSALSARPIAALLNVLESRRSGYLLVGADRAARLLGAFLKDQGKRVVMVDMNRSNLKKAAEEEIEIYNLDVFQDELVDAFDLESMKYLLTLTGSSDVNNHVLSEYASSFDSEMVFRVQNGIPNDVGPVPALALAPYDDHINLMEVARDHPQIHLVNYGNRDDFERKIKIIRSHGGSIPLCIWSDKQELKPLVDRSGNLHEDQGNAIIYLGQTVSFQDFRLHNPE